MLIRPEQATDVPAIRAVTVAAFTGPPHPAPDADCVPTEAGLVAAGAFRYAAPFARLCEPQA